MQVKIRLDHYMRRHNAVKNRVKRQASGWPSMSSGGTGAQKSAEVCSAAARKVARNSRQKANFRKKLEHGNEKAKKIKYD